jgi:hypothetical protein
MAKMRACCRTPKGKGPHKPNCSNSISIDLSDVHGPLIEERLAQEEAAERRRQVVIKQHRRERGLEDA